MPNYQNGKIYKLWSPEGDDIYIGSTTQSLCRRKEGHKKLDCSSKILFEKYEEVIIELIEYFPCNNKEELNKKEGEHIRKNECINKQIAGRTHKEYREENADKFKEYNKKYNEENADKIKEYNKKYYEENPDKIKKYRENNSDKIKEQKSKYRELNRDIINQKQREKRKEKKNE